MTHDTSTLKIEDQVKFLGCIDDQGLRKAYLRASIFCMPSTAELQSLATLEAMSASLPVMLADALALPALVKENLNGYLFKPGDYDDLANKIKHFFQLPDELKNRMGQQSRHIISSHSLENTLSIYEKMYRNQLNKDSISPNEDKPKKINRKST
ncbi:glycosyltransferase [Legionella antarctica]|nr:glycosyltransferase [Legionella antarctica]